MLPDFELGKWNKESFVEGTFAQFNESPFEVESGCCKVLLMLLKVCCFDEAGRDWIQINKLFKNDSAFIEVSVSLFKLEVSVPSELWRLPSHPVFKNPSDWIKFSQHFFHQGIFVPKLFNPRHVFTSPFPNIACTLNELVSHLHFCVLKPQSHVLEINGDTSFKNWSGSFEFPDRSFPFSIL